MLRVRNTLSCVLVVLSACAQSGGNRHATLQFSTDAFVLYAAISFELTRSTSGLTVRRVSVPHEIPAEGIAERLAILSRATAGSPDPGVVDASTLGSFVYAQNLSLDMGELAVSLPASVDVVSIERFDATSSPPDYSKQPAPGRVKLQFSPIGYSEHGDQAMLYVETFCGSLCGTGLYIVLQREGDSWRVTYRFLDWVS